MCSSAFLITLALLPLANAQNSYCAGDECLQEAASVPSLLQTTRQNERQATPLSEDTVLITRDPAAGPEEPTDSVSPDAWQMVFLELNDTAVQDATRSTCMKVVFAILMRAEQLDLASGSHTHSPDKVMKDLKAARDAGKDPWKVLRTDHGAMLTSIEKFAESTEPDEVDPSLVLTSDCLDMMNGRTDTPEISNSSNVVEGDMQAPNRDQALLIQALAENGARWAPNKWENPGRIPYCFSRSASSSARKAVEDAVDHYKDMVPCIQFEEVGVASESQKFCTEKPGIFIKGDEGGCFASLGANDPDYYPTVCNLRAGGCDTMGIAIHELGHNLGMMHEQARSDYAKYVKILWQNIQPQYRSQYEVSNDADTRQPYDYMSVMHYSDTSFGVYKNGEKQKTMEKLTSSSRTMGNRMGLTHSDALQVAQMYGCATPQNFKVCDGSCSHSACVCHQDPSKPNEIIKTTDSNGCHRCEKRCPDYPSGTSGSCGCVSGYSKGSFSSGGGTYSYCKRSTSSPAPSPVGAVRCMDSKSYCPSYKAYCVGYSFSNGGPVKDVCRKTCNNC